MKRHPHLQPLSDDHHGALVLARRVALAAKQTPGRGALTKVWADLQDRFAQELEPHFRVEEERLFPQLEAAGERALAERLAGLPAREVFAYFNNDPGGAAVRDAETLMRLLEDLGAPVAC